MWDHHDRGTIWDTAAARWAGQDASVAIRRKAEEKEGQHDFKSAVLSGVRLTIEYLKKQDKKEGEKQLRDLLKEQRKR